MEIFRTDSLLLESARGAASKSDLALEYFRSLHVPDGMPFIVRTDDRPASELYVHELNAFLRDLPAWGCRSHNTWTAYARDIVSLAGFMRARGRGDNPIYATYEDMRAYRNARLNGNPPELSAKSWNRMISAFEKLFEWAVVNSLISETPFKYRKGRSGGRWAPKEINSLKVPVSEDDVVKCVTIEQFRFFRDVGLRGRLPDGLTPDTQSRVKNGFRNALIADLLLNTGMRETEAMALFDEEFPAFESSPLSRISCPLDLPPAITKGQKRRSTLLPVGVLRDLDHYRRGDREDAIARGVEKGLYGDDRFIHATAGTKASFRITSDSQSKLWPFEKIKPELRRKLIVHDLSRGSLQPAQLFLNNDGTPMPADNLRPVFARACERCERYGVKLHISPHTLRHTFAVHMLSLLMRDLIMQLGDLSNASRRTSREAFQHVALNPLLQLRKLLGHASVETTYKYLTYVVENQASLQSEALNIKSEMSLLGEIASQFGGARA